MHRYLFALAFLSALLAPLPSQAAPLYTVSFLPDAQFSPYAMNNAGQIVGTRGGAGLRAVFYDGARQFLTLPDAESSLAYGINDAGAVTGVYLSLTDSNAHAFVYRNGSLRDLGAGTAGFGINASGDVVGVAQAAGGGNTGFLDRNGVRTELGNLGAGTSAQALGINDRGQIVGNSTLGAETENAPTHPFLYSDGALLDLGTLAGANDNSAVAINNAGQVVGYSEAADGSAHAFVYEGGVMRDLGGFGTAQMNIRNINQHGRFVGTAITGAGGDVPFVSLGGRLVDLNTLIDPALGWTLYSADLNNDFDQIVGSGCYQGMCGLVRLDLAGAVPEPRAAWLLVPGLLVLVGARRRQRRGEAFAGALA